jgi:oxygen-dependent protoporphyrinogen oxidase
MTDHPILVIGAGIAGLSAAWELTRAGQRALVLEAANAPGGVIATTARDGFVAEEGPDSFLTSKTAMTTLCRELGLADDIVAALPQPGGARVLHHGELQALPAGWRMLMPTRLEPVLESPLFSAEVKRAIAAHWDAEAPPRADESIAAYLRRRFGALAGHAITDTVAGPMAAGVYGGDAEQLAVPQLGPVPSPAPGTPPPPSIFSSLRAGMGSLVERLQASLPLESLRLHCPARSVTAHAGGFHVRTGEATVDARAVIVAAPAWAAAPMLANLDPALAEPLSAVAYGSSLNINFAYTPAPPLPPGYGFLVPRPEGYQMLACTFAHQKLPHRAPAGSALVRVFYAGESVALDDAAAIALARRELEAILGLRAQPLWTRLRRAPRSLPLYTVGHTQRLRELSAALEAHPRLALAGSAYQGVGVPDCIASGRAAAQGVLAALGC